MMPDSEFRQRLRSRDPVNGAIVGMPSPGVVELVGVAGFDFVVIDTEHGSISAEGVEHMIRAADSFGLPAIVRIPRVDRGTIQLVLDAGATGIQVPMVETAEDIALAVTYTKYVEQGSRGIATNRASGYRRMGAALAETLNDSTVVIAQVETARGVDAAAAIAAVPQVDCVFIGPTDLAQSLGVIGQLGGERVTEALHRVVSDVSSVTAVGTLVADPADGLRKRAAGLSLLEVAVTPLVVRALEAFVTGFPGPGVAGRLEDPHNRGTAPV